MAVHLGAIETHYCLSQPFILTQFPDPEMLLNQTAENTTFTNSNICFRNVSNLKSGQTEENRENREVQNFVSEVNVNFVKTEAQKYSNLDDNCQEENNQEQCELRRKTFAARQAVQVHQTTPHKEKYVCDVCEKTYISRYHLKQHMNKVHPQNAMHLKCHLCDYRTHNRFNLKGHIDRHNKAASFICDECGKGFYSRSTLEEHKKGKHGPGFRCDVCGAVLTSMSNLRQHKKTHEPKSAGVKYQCDICGQGYRARSKCAFRLHVLKHQGIVKQFKCSDCNKVLTSDNSYRQHLRKHSGEKPFICEFCSKAFSEKKYLQVHRRIHTGEKPYECDICGVCFNQRSTMTSHRRSHVKS